MTDTEIIKRCAEKMGFEVGVDIHGAVFFKTDGTKQPYRMDYDPLRDDAQAMALVKRFNLEILQQDEGKTVRVRYPWSAPSLMTGWYDDINRAICECVAALP